MLFDTQKSIISPLHFDFKGSIAIISERANLQCTALAHGKYTGLHPCLSVQVCNDFSSQLRAFPLAEI